MVESFKNFLDRNEPNSTFSILNGEFNSGDQEVKNDKVIMLPSLSMEYSELERYLWERYQIKIK